MGWYFGVIGKFHNDEFLVYILTGKVKMVPHIYLIKQCIIVDIGN